MSPAGAPDDLLALLRTTPGVAAVYPARSIGRRLLSALDPDGAATGAAGWLGVHERDGVTRIEVSVGLDGTVPAPVVGRGIAGVVAARTPGVRPDEVVVRIVGFD